MNNQKEQNTQWGRYMTTSNPFVHPFFAFWWDFVKQREELRVLEPFVGEGHLPYHMTLCGYEAQWGFNDIRPVTLYEKLEALWASKGQRAVTVTQEDMLLNNGEHFPKGYPIIITNPPFLAKNSAARKKIPYQGSAEDADVYQTALRLCLNNAPYVGILIPESFLTQSLFLDRCWGTIQMPREFFKKTKHPVMLALFGPRALKEVFLKKFEESKEDIIRQSAGVYKKDERSGRGSPGRAHNNENHKNARPDFHKVHLSAKAFGVLQGFLDQWQSQKEKDVNTRELLSTEDFVVFRQDQYLGCYRNLYAWKHAFDQMIEQNPRLRKKASVLCNVANGQIGLFATDSTRKASIRFVKSEQIAEHISIVQSARSVSKIKIEDNYLEQPRAIEDIIGLSNALLEYYRGRTQDAFLTGFQEVRLDGAVRKRLDFVTAKKILLISLGLLKKHQKKAL